MSHELRTPLNAVIGFSEVLLDQMFGEVNERQEEYLRDIRASGRHLLELLNEILDLSKVEAGHMELDYATFACARCSDYGLSLMRERAAQHGIELRSTWRRCGSGRGRRAPPQAGRGQPPDQRGEVHRRTAVTSWSGARDGADELVVTVTDDGIGVPTRGPRADLRVVPAGRRGAPKEEGTGLGLTLSRRIVELLGGRLWLESEVGAAAPSPSRFRCGRWASAIRRRMSDRERCRRGVGG